jgi:peptidoglycan endopeptidase LytE
MKNFSLILLFTLFTFSIYSQEKYTKHIISQGETINHIALKYNIEPSDIYKLNPEANKTLQLKQVLLIPKPKEVKTSTKSKAIETVRVEVKEKLKETKDKSKVKTQEIATVEEQYHLVLAKETIYGITKKYGITAEALIKANPSLETEGLKLDQNILIPGIEKNNKLVSKGELIKSDSKSKTKENSISIEKNTKTQTVLAVSTEKTEESFEHEVVAKETKYGIAKKYGITVAELEKANPEIINQLPVGFKLNIINAKTEVKEAVLVKQNSNNAELEKDNENKKETTFFESNYSPDDLVLKLIETASEKIGTRYRAGGTSTDGFDCSGLVYSTFSSFDIKLPRSSFDQSFFGTRIENKEVKKGDLIFFKTNGKGRINHVGLVVEVLDDQIKFIHSSTSSGVIISSTKESYYERNFVQVNRVL